MPGLQSLSRLTRSRPAWSNPTVTKDVTYATVRSAAQKIDLYAPKTVQPLTILHVHGGAWNSSATGNTKDTLGESAYPRCLSAFGGALIAEMEYPLIPVASGNVDTTYRQQMVDAVVAAIAWLRTNAATYNGSTTRLVIWGESAGGHLVLLTAAQTKGLGTGPDMVVAFSAQTQLDLVTKVPQQNYLGISTDNASGAGAVTAQLFSPYSQWTEPNVPVYLLCDVNDPLDTTNQILYTRNMATQITGLGGHVTKVETTYGIHADFNSKPELLTAYRACQTTLAA